jgi:hypothetical protein
VLATILIYFIFTPRNSLPSGNVHHIQQQTPVHSLVVPASALVPSKESAKNVASTVVTVN